jgi:hypothetical protein
MFSRPKPRATGFKFKSDFRSAKLQYSERGSRAPDRCSQIQWT